MGKVAAAAASTGVLGTGGAATLVAHQLGAFGGGNGRFDPIRTLSEFKNDNGGHCLGKIFVGQSPNSNHLKTKPNLQGVTTDTVKLGDKSKGKVNGCLFVGWSKEKSSGNVWGGNIRFTWAAAGENVGFVVLLEGKTKGDKSMDFDAVAFVYEKQENVWNPTKKMDAKQESKTLKENELLNKFPKKGSEFLESATVGELWEFLDASGLVKSVDGDGSNTDAYEYTWNAGVGSGNEDTEMKSWSSNMDAWWNHFFDNSKWNMSDVVKGIKGAWMR